MGTDTARGAYLTIAQTLKGEIESGAIAQDDAMPSESALCTRFDVARETVRRALAELEREGLIVTVPGKGRFVGAKRETAADVAETLRAEVAGEGVSSGDRFASEGDLVRRFGISRYTAQKVLAELERDGLLVVRPGKGRYVA